MSSPAVATVGTNADADTDNLITIWSEARLLFADLEGRQPAFAPGAASRAMPGLSEQRKARQFCDVVFKATDGAEVWAHRFVMAARFSGCANLFNVTKKAMTKDQDQEQQEWMPPIRVVVSDMSSDMLELLVDFAYHVPLHGRIGLHNVGQVLEMAEKYNISKIREHCINMLKQNLEPDSCINIYHLALNRGYDNLAADALRYLIRHFDEVWENDEQFQSLTAEEFRIILSDNRLHAPSEVDHTFRAILKWISADAAGRKKYLAQLLPLVRFARCTVSEFDRVVTDPQIQADGDSLRVLNAIHQSLTRQSMALGECAGVDLSSKLWLTPRIPKDILFLFGGWTSGATNNMHAFNCRTGTWRLIGNQYTTPRAYHGAAVLNSCIYFVGGFNGRECYHSVVCFDVNLNRWSHKANMLQARCYVSVATLQGLIYAMGGFDGRLRTSSVERYDAKKNQWTLVAAMNDVRSDAAATTAAGRIYIVGGFTGREVLDTVECYDPSSNTWTRVLTMSTPRSGVKVATHKDIIYVIGGYNGVTRLSSMEQLDTRRARFSELPSMSQARSNFATVVLEGFIYAIGGFSGLTTVSLVERYDIEGRKWYPAQPISMNCSASAASIVYDVLNPEAWL
ncbi:kelch-like protein 10 [Amblyomma americanum]